MRRLAESSPQPHAGIAAVLENWLLEHPAAHTIAAYAALPGEVNPGAAIARNPDRRWLFPRVEGRELRFHEIGNPDRDLVAGAFGVREPAASMPIVGIDEIDAFFCPGLAFDARGGRLGRGMGFYDRMLAHARPGALKIGICFRWQIVDDTCAEAHDIAMDHVISI